MPGKNLFAAIAVAIALASLAIVVTGDERFAGSPSIETQLAGALSESQRDDVRGVVRNYLIENPDVIVEALEVLQARRQNAQQNLSSQALTGMQAELVASNRDPVLGPDNASVTLVEFFDYNCPYCRRVMGPVMTLLQEDKDLRLVFKEFPILSEDSVVAARAALAAKNQGKYRDFHVALMNRRGGLSMRNIEAIAKKVGIDLERMRKDMEKADVTDTVQANYKLAQAIGVNGTPAFVIGDQIVPGAVDISRLRDLVKQQRAKKN